MIGLIRRLAARLQKLPFWIKVPLVIMEGIALSIFVVWIYFTRTVDTVRVPDVIDHPLRKAKLQLQSRDLSFRIVTKNSMKTPENHVIRQIPLPGSRVKETRQIDLYVSQGPEYVRVPDLRGKTLLSAKNYLYRRTGGGEETVGPLLNMGNIARVYSPNRESERIMLQDPQPGSQVVRGTQVDLLVSKGPWPKRTVVPDVRNKELDQARRFLDRNHLETGDIRYQLETDKPASVILKQHPPSGRIVSRGQAVSLTVNLSETAEVAPRRYTFIRINPPLGLEKGRMKVKLVDRQGERIVFNKRVKPGREVQFMVSIRGPAKLIVFWNGEIYQFRRLEYRR